MFHLYAMYTVLYVTTKKVNFATDETGILLSDIVFCKRKHAHKSMLTFTG